MRLLPQGKRNNSVKEYGAKYLRCYQSWYSVILVSSLVPVIMGLLVILASLTTFVSGLELPEAKHPVIGFAAGVQLLCVFYMAFAFQMVVRSFKPYEQLPEVEDAVLVGMMKALRERNSSMPKDRAFALYGVLQALKVVSHEGLKVESANSLGQVYYELFRDLMLWNPRLICLLLDVGPPIPHAPSWVPDWSTLRERSWIKHDVIYETVTSNAKSPRIKIDGHELTVEATILGAASFVTDPFSQIDIENADNLLQEMTPNLAAALSQFSGWLGAISRDIPVSPTYESPPKAIMDVLSGRVNSFDNANAHSFNQWRRIISEWNLRVNENSIDDLATRVAGDPSALGFTVKTCKRLSQRRGLFSSIDGHIGSGPPNMLLGDKIALLSGVSRPLVLREHPQRPEVYNVIGPAFVCGYTDWEKAHQAQVWDSLVLV